MYELKVTVSKGLGTCTANPPMQQGDCFTVRDGSIQIPAEGYVCLWALQSLLPLITPKEREIAEPKEEDWMWRVHHAQCPDPAGRVISGSSGRHLPSMGIRSSRTSRYLPQVHL